MNFANERDYQIADKQVFFRTGLVKDGERTTKLEPLPLAFLHYLVHNAGKVVARDALIEHVWCNRYVSDDAIRRVVKKLRAALGDDAKEPKFIKTIPMQGYVLIASPLLLEEVEKQSSASFSWRFVQWLKANQWLGFALLQVFVLLSVLAYLELRHSQGAQSGTASDSPVITLLTQMSGSEINATYHPKHDTALFIHRENNDSPFSLVRKNLTTGLVHKLTFDANNYLYVIFSKDGDYVAFSKDTANGVKSYVAEYRDSGFSNIQPLSLGSGDATVLSFGQDNNTLYVAAQSSGHKEGFQNAVYKYLIRDKRMQQVTFPFVKGYGDYAAKLSPDGRYLAIARNVSERRYHLLIHDLHQQNIVSEINLGFFASNLVWEKERSDKLVITSFKGDMYYFDLRTEQLREQAGSGPGLNDAFYSCGHKCVFMRQHHMNYKDNVELKNPFSQSEVTQLSYFANPNADFSPIYNPAGNGIIYASKSAEKGEIKSLDLSGHEQVLYTFNPRHIVTDLSVSPLNDKLLGKLEERLFVLDLNSKQFTQMSSVEEQVDMPMWNSSGTGFYYTRIEGTTDVLYFYDVLSAQKQKVEEGILARKEINTEKSFVLDSQYQLWLETSQGKRERLVQFKHRGQFSWHVHSDYVYWTEQDKLNVYLNRVDVHSKQVERQVLFENSWDLEFSMHPQGDRLLVSHSLLANSNLVKVQWP